MNRIKQLIEELNKRILVLDGAMGTMIQARDLGESDFRGRDFLNHPHDLKGNYDILSLTRPDIIESIHQAYLKAGADIITTNTFSANAISQIDYHLNKHVYEMNRISAQIARKTADEFTIINPEKPRFVAGSLGPTNRTCSISPDVNYPGYRNITFDQMRDAYAEQAGGLIDGGVDILLIETVFDTLNAKAAIFAISELFDKYGYKLPVWISGTFSDASGRTLTGQTPEAFWISIRHANPLCVGLNCALGAEALRPQLEEIAGLADTYVSIHPNAGLPNELGGYDESPEHMAKVLGGFAVRGLVNIVGGCCGTTAAHIEAIAGAVDGLPPRRPRTPEKHCRLSGLEPLNIRSDSLFVNIGERTNVMGSAKFAGLIKDGKFEEALAIAGQQVRDGAQVIDINMDEAMIDSVRAMVTFLNLIAAEPEISRIPIMLDSSRWDVIEAGLKCLQGKGIVNSISLKDGVDEFKRRAALVRKYGAAAIVMAFDEQGQASTYERKIEICTRSYNILINEIGFPPEDIILDPNIFSIATGMKEHDNYAVDYIKACKTIKETLPYALVSGGVSNLSFSFRGNNVIREAMHSVFLYHAIRAGMDMGIVNPGQLTVYDEIPADLLEAVEDVVLNRRENAADRLADLAGRLKGKAIRKKDDVSWREQSVEHRLAYAMINGVTDYIQADIEQARSQYGSALKVIEGPLMSGMNKVGDMFGSGKMFLPQVVKSARVMKKAVSFLEPYLDSEKENGQAKTNGKIILATVKGDVHDIGKNIVGVVLGCNNYEIIDLGVMVSAERILETAGKEKVDIIGLSGLITPSLLEMEHIAAEMERQGFNIPLLVGGATTSKVHTAVKIDSVYRGPVVHVEDASRSAMIVNNLTNKDRKSEYMTDIKKQYKQIRQKHIKRESAIKIIPLSEARKRKFLINRQDYQVYRPDHMGITIFDDYSLTELLPYINWIQFLRVWELRKNITLNHNDSIRNKQADELLLDAQKLLSQIVDNKFLQARIVIGLFPANAIGDDIEIYADKNRKRVKSIARSLRQQDEKLVKANCLCLSDFIAPRESSTDDYLGAFAVSAGFGVDKMTREFEADHDYYQSILVKALADRLAEALAERIHQLVRIKYWGYAAAEKVEGENLFSGKYRGIRPAPGYPTCPDHSEKATLFDLLDVKNKIGIDLTENYAMTPLASVCGWYFAHPQARYFHVGKIGRDQVSDYATRKNLSVEEVERLLKPNLSY